MKYTINQLLEEEFQDVYKVYDVFVHHFGEDKVDLKSVPDQTNVLHRLEVYNCKKEENGDTWDVSDEALHNIRNAFRRYKPIIYVWWPEVTITNEHNKSIKIKDLYAKIGVTREGCIPMENHGFLLTKATYSQTQFESRYVHSHLPSLLVTDECVDLSFQKPCLGRGPIKQTILQLRTDNSEIEWMLFCEELDRYVTVESLAGVPYRKLEEVGNLSPVYSFSYDYIEEKADIYKFIKEPNWIKDNLEDFILYYLNLGHLSFNFVNGTFHCSMSYFDYLIDISNAFIDWANQQNLPKEVIDYIYFKEVLHRVYIKEGKFYKKSGSASRHPERYEGRAMGFSFKNHYITLHIESNAEEENRPSLILDNNLANYIIQHILIIINYHYTDEYINNSRETSSSSSQGTEGNSPTSSQAVYYI